MNCGRHPHKTSVCNSLMCLHFISVAAIPRLASLLCFFDNVFDAYVVHDTISVCDASIKRGL